LNTQPVVSMYVQKESTANTIAISRQVDREIKLLKEILDKDINIISTFNQAEHIKQAVDQVKKSLYYGAILATLVLFVFLKDFRSVGIIGITIPLSILCTFSLMFFGKITINVMTLSGLALGVGMLVDNSIVVLENIFKKRQEFIEQQGVITNPADSTAITKELSITATDEMLLAITTSTLTTIVIFLPLVFINPEIRMLYSGIAFTITFSLLASFLTSITLVPMLTAKLKFKHSKANKLEPMSSESAESQNLNNYKPPFSKKIIAFYQAFLKLSLTLRYLILILIFFLFSLMFKQAKKLEKEFIGIAEQNKFTVFIEMPTGTKLEISDKIVSEVEKIISNQPEIKTFTAKVEPWSSKIYVELLPLTKRKLSTSQIIEKIRPFTDKIEPAFIYYEEPEEIGTKEIILELFGYDYEILKGLAIQVAQRLQQIPKFTDVKIRMREGRPEVHLAIDKKQAALFGLNVESIALALHTHMRGLVATRYRGTEIPLIKVKEVYQNQSPPKKERESVTEKSEIAQMSPTFGKAQAKEIETIVRLEEKFRRTFSDLRRMSFVTPIGERVFLYQLADFKFELGPSEIWRKNKFRMIQVSANTGGTALGTSAELVKHVLTDLKFPKDYFWQFGGNYDKMLQNQKELSFAIILSLLFVYMIMASLFESIIQPFIILCTVPLAAMGAIAALRITHKPVGIGALIGAIMLGGIVVNNAIILIDRINFLKRKKNISRSDSREIRKIITLACSDRLRPIMMTSITTILGLLPMALDKSESAALWTPLAITVIGGLTTSTFLTLFIIPNVYLMFEDIRIIRR
ncbi:MAG: efflux RND transporter permease subunit, partial [Candidatus Omnitrophica bacterium]|nr:efflux RND transporter permease subunit [Candidatus Omnitrophota bacterium]